MHKGALPPIQAFPVQGEVAAKRSDAVGGVVCDKLSICNLSKMIVEQSLTRYAGAPFTQGSHFNDIKLRSSPFTGGAFLMKFAVRNAPGIHKTNHYTRDLLYFLCSYISVFNISCSALQKPATSFLEENGPKLTRTAPPSGVPSVSCASGAQ